MKIDITCTLMNIYQEIDVLDAVDVESEYMEWPKEKQKSFREDIRQSMSLDESALKHNVDISIGLTPKYENGFTGSVENECIKMLEEFVSKAKMVKAKPGQFMLIQYANERKQAAQVLANVLSKVAEVKENG